MQDFIKVIEQAGFSVTNGDDYENIEISDSRNNNELLEKKSHMGMYWFKGTNGREIFLSDLVKIINVENGLQIKKISNQNKYVIEVALSDGTKGIIEVENDLKLRQQDIRGNKAIGQERILNKNIVEVGITVKKEINEKSDGKGNISYGDLHIFHGVFGTTIRINDNSTTYGITNCSTELYLNFIIDFLNNNELTSNNLKFQEAFRIVLPVIRQNIDNIFAVHQANIGMFLGILEEYRERAQEAYRAKTASIDECIQRIIKSFELDKIKLKKEYDDKMEHIDDCIGTLEIISKPHKTL